MTFDVAPIVEGHGDVAALPVLLRRMGPSLNIKRPVRFPKSRLLIDDHLRRAVEIAASNITARGAVLLVMDADESCAATLGPELEAKLNSIAPKHTSRVVLPVREFEAWIVGGDLSYEVGDPESCGDLKRRIRQHRGVYGESVDQPRLISSVDLTILEQRSRSFRRLRKVVDEFLTLQ